MQASSANTDYSEQLQAKKSSIIDHVIIAIALGLIPLSCFVIYFGVTEGWGNSLSTQLIIFVVIWVLAIRRDFLTPRRRAVAITIFLLVAALADVLRYGLVSVTYPLLATLPIFAAAIRGLRWGIASLGVVMTALIVAGWWNIHTRALPPVEMPEFFFSGTEWSVQIINVFIASLMGVYVIGTLYRFLASSGEDLNARNIELAQSRTFRTQSAKLAGLGTALADPAASRILECDDAFAQMHGLLVEDFTGLNVDVNVISQLIHEDDRQSAWDLRKRLVAGETVFIELRHVWPDGTIRHLRKTFVPHHQPSGPDGLFDVVCQDVTEERLLQEKLFQAQKMDAIGKLTGGVAHDFNNLLAVILMNLELVNMESTNPIHQELLGSAIQATQRGAELTGHMLSFAQRAKLIPAPVDLNLLVRNLIDWTSRTVPSSITIQLSLCDGPWLTTIDASSAESAILNLTVNARHAMSNGGRLTIATSNVVIGDHQDAAQDEQHDLTPGRYVQLVVSDTGDGIPAETLENIFDPFFTTKAVGEGSGLGLAMVSGFMRQSGGIVRVTSKVGVGTSFKLYFPAAQNDEVAVADPLAEPVPIGQISSGKILVVEDEADVMKVVRVILSKAGFRVVSATSGDEALATFEQSPDFDLLLTDLVMPGKLHGIALAEALWVIQPSLPVVFLSGYADAATANENEGQTEGIHLTKPVTRETLLRAIHTALAQS